MSKNRTPAQQQRYDLKQQYPDCLLLFRLGDFYELFHEDAHIAHKELALTLTAKNKKSDNPIPMAGIPYHAVDKYIPKLIKAGYKIAIAEQIGEVTPGSVVERKIIDIITPGTYIEEETETCNILACWFGGNSKNQYHLARGDYSLGKFYTRSVGSFQDSVGFIDRINPKELVIHHAIPERENFEKRAKHSDYMVSIHDHPSEIDGYLKGILDVETLEGFGSGIVGGRKHAIATLFSYIQQYQNKNTLYVHSIEDESIQEYVKIDPISIKNLEIFRSSYEGTEKHALFGVINKCSTAQGKRKLKDWLLYPLRDSEEIHKRYSLVEYFASHRSRDQIVKYCRGIIDIPRIMSRILYKSPSPYTVQSLMQVLIHIFANSIFVEGLKKVGMSSQQCKELEQLKTILSNALKSDFESDERGFIKEGFDSNIDKLSHILTSTDQTLRDYYRYLKENTGLQTIKLTYTRNQGYAITISNKEADRFKDYFDPDNQKHDFVRTKSLKSSQRYTSSYLDMIQDDLIEAQEVLHDEEYRVLQEIIVQIKEYRTLIEELSNAIACVDIFSMIAYKLDMGWVVPTCLGMFDGSSDKERFFITEGRHPVVEEFLPNDEHFIPNDYRSGNTNFFQLITGPNMGGKSTYLRQNALILLLAHCGLPVPAKTVQFHILDGIFARVGSGDALAQNQSTFMTEMIEMSFILRNASSDSFIVLDELGRGTSTYDGMALAEAITVYLCQYLRASTLFATHYHELIDLDGKLDGFSNKSVGVYENNNDIVFLKKIVDGGASKSYGIDVAKLAGMPEEIVENARKILQKFDSDDGQESQMRSKIKHNTGNNPLPFGVIEDANKQSLDKIKALLSDLNINDITPLEALVILQKILGLLGK